MRCAKCGLIQLAAPTCQNCGKTTGISDASCLRPTASAAVAAARPPAPPPVTHAAASDATDVERALAEPTVIRQAADDQTERTDLLGEPTVRLVESAQAGADAERRLTFAGSAGTLLGIHIVNVLLTILTLGIYYFWGKVRVRSYLLSQTEFEGDRFAYHGTGRELLVGTLKAGLVFGALSALFNAAPMLPGGLPVMIGAILVGYIGMLVLIPVAMVGSRRYRLSRTSWRNILFSFQGNVGEFVKLFVGGALLTGLTLGLYSPFFATNRHAFMVSHSRFGDRSFGFDGRGRDLFGPYLLALLLTVPTLGLVWLWYSARRTRYYWGHTSFGSARFASTMTGRGLFGLHLVNLVLLVVTFGLAWPLVTVRNLRFEFTNLSLIGALDAESVQQDARTATATGDGLGDFLELDTGFAA
ncbi:MAG: YjgN family protein [Nitrospirota bacterium]